MVEHLTHRRIGVSSVARLAGLAPEGVDGLSHQDELVTGNREVPMKRSWRVVALTVGALLALPVAAAGLLVAAAAAVSFAASPRSLSTLLGESMR